MGKVIYKIIVKTQWFSVYKMQMVEKITINKNLN